MHCRSLTPLRHTSTIIIIRLPVLVSVVPQWDNPFSQVSYHVRREMLHREDGLEWFLDLEGREPTRQGVFLVGASDGDIDRRDWEKCCSDSVGHQQRKLLRFHICWLPGYDLLNQVTNLVLSVTISSILRVQVHALLIGSGLTTLLSFCRALLIGSGWGRWPPSLIFPWKGTI